MNKLKTNRGITLVSLIITIVVMLIIAGTTIYTSTDRFKINNVNKMYNDIELLNDKISTYYMKYGGIPILNNTKYTFSELNFDKNVNDDLDYYIIDLAAIGNITLNYGEEGYKNPNTSDDVYIINNKTHTVYYVKGIENTEGNMIHSKGVVKDNNNDNVPPTKPQIKVIAGTQDKEHEGTTDTNLYYTSDVTLEFIPGKDNWSGISKTTYSIDGGTETDISTLIDNKYNINTSGSYEIKLKSYDNSNNVSEEIRTINIGTMQQVEYLQSTGTQYIDTGIIPSNNTGIDIDFCALEYVPKEQPEQYTCFIFGGESGWQNASFDFQAGLYGLVYNLTKVGTTYNTATLNDRNTNKHNLKIINQQYYFDSKFQYDLSKVDNTNWKSNSSIILFGIKRNGNIQRLDSSKIYGCKIYDGDTLVRDFIPVLDENNVACLFDKVEEKFYYNGGTGNFTTNLQ